MANKAATIPYVASTTQGLAQTTFVAVKVRNVKSASPAGGGSQAPNLSPTTGQIWPRGVIK